MTFGYASPPYGSTFLSERAPPSGDLRALLRERMSEFQVTSDESFEASLMAGGYGRYKTVDGIEAPSAFTSTFPQRATPSLPPPPTTKSDTEFASIPTDPRWSGSGSQAIAPVKQPSSSYISDGLQVVELPGTGRVLVPSSTLQGKRSRAKKADAPNSPISPYPVPGWTAVGPRGLGGWAKIPEAHAGPDWVDGHFPWSARWEERIRVREEAVVKFLEREDDEGDSEDDGAGPTTTLSRYYEN
ncbi:hypothetical protein CPB85DRAFT_164938 [Mucidula mucida]|nr:hypothetical protein CPB85DRAFT_164938 [Mucidula mucida]